jgi:hypothetical protein
MKTFPLLVLALGASLYLGCSSDPDRSGSDSANVVENGSCSEACGGPSSEGSCWCDDQCARYGDCCLDAAEQCSVNECLANDDCGRGRQCSIGVTCAELGCPPPPPNDCIDEAPPPDSCCDPGNQPPPFEPVACCLGPNGAAWQMTGSANPCGDVNQPEAPVCELPSCCDPSNKPPPFEPVACCLGPNGAGWQMTGSGNPCGDVHQPEAPVCQ